MNGMSGDSGGRRPVTLDDVARGAGGSQPTAAPVLNGMSGDSGVRRPVTLDDVARVAGVSQPTASRVLNGSSRKVAESYRERVLEAARELGYTPNLPAQAMARGTSRTIALVISLISD